MDAGEYNVSGSATTQAATSMALFAKNPRRRGYLIGAPQTAGIWFNPVGGSCGPNLADCFWLAAQAFYEAPSSAASRNGVTIYCDTGSLVVPAFEW